MQWITLVQSHSHNAASVSTLFIQALDQWPSNLILNYCFIDIWKESIKIWNLYLLHEISTELAISSISDYSVLYNEISIVKNYDPIEHKNLYLIFQKCLDATSYNTLSVNSTFILK